MSNREEAKKVWELEKCRRVAEAINEADGADYEAQPSNAEPADVVLVSKSKKFVQRPAQVVSIPLDFRHRDDKGTVEKLKRGLAELLRNKGMEHLLVGVIPSGDAEMHGVKEPIVEQLAEIVAKEGRDRDLVLGYGEIYERSPELAESIHNIFVSHHDAIPEIEIDIPAGSAVPGDGQWIEEGVWKKLKKYGNEKAVENLMLVIGVAGFVDDQQIEAFQRANPTEKLPFAEVWIVTPFHGVVCLKRRKDSS
jgi:hypothetical protein